MSNCVDCPNGPQHHDDVLNDISIINAVIEWSSKGYMKQAIETLEGYQHRLINRHKELTGRQV